MNGPLLYLVIAALVIYMIARQFMVQQVNLGTLVALPILSAYASYTELQADFAHFTLMLLAIGLSIGLAVGVVSGIYRGRYTRVFLDDNGGRCILSKPQLPSSLIWLGLFVVRVAGSILLYTDVGKTNMWMSLLAIAISILFVASIATQKWIVYQKSTRLRQTGVPQQFSSLRSR